jgi:hypothetical protein
MFQTTNQDIYLLVYTNFCEEIPTPPRLGHLFSRSWRAAERLVNQSSVFGGKSGGEMKTAMEAQNI